MEFIFFENKDKVKQTQAEKVGGGGSRLRICPSEDSAQRRS